MIALLIQQELHNAGCGIEFGTDRATGLSAPEAARRLAVYGPNELAEAVFRNVWVVAWKQATATMVMIVILPVMILATVGDYIDAVVIVTFVGLNAVIGFHHAFRAEKANAVLKRLAVPRVRVRRDGCLREIAAREVVVGDLMLLEAGNAVAADGWLMDAETLRTQEDAVTGSCAAVDKVPATSRAQAVRASAVGNQGNMVFMGATVTHGCGHAVVTDTGMRTVKGMAKISRTVQHGPTPVQPGLDHLSWRLAFVALALVCLTLVVSRVRSESGMMWLTEFSVAEAAVPDGLLAVVTIALASGAQRMLRRRVLIRKLAAV